MFRWQNNQYVKTQPPAYYAGNKLYKNAHTRNDYPTRTSRRVHDNLVISANYGIDTTSDDINSSPYSSPYYINGRYNSDNLYTQRGNSASVQGCTRLISLHDEEDDFDDSDIATTIVMQQGKQIKFELPYHGKVVGNTITLRNTNACTGILSMYFSATQDGAPIYETAIDLCSVSQDKFEHFKVYGVTPVAANANPLGVLYVRMEIWDELDCERSANPFNTEKTIEIAACGEKGHMEALVALGEKNLPVREAYEYAHKPNCPLMGLIYNNYHALPVNRTEPTVGGATVSLNGYRYDVFGIKSDTDAELVIYDKAMNRIIENTAIRVDGASEQVNLVQVTDYVYYVDGYSRLQKFKIGEWISQEVKDSDPEKSPVVAPSIITFHNNRIYLSGFRYDPNLFQYSVIGADGPEYENFYFRQYSPDVSPLSTSINPITAIVEFSGDTLMISGKTFHSLYRTNTTSGTAEEGYAQQVSTYTDGGGVNSAGDICNYQGVIYSFDPDEGLRRFTGSIWNRVPNDIDSYWERVDMTQPRRLWGYANKLYFNYVDRVDHKYKILVWDMKMNYQQYPFFQDVDMPIADVRYSDDFDLVGMHAEYPCIMKLFAEDTWKRLDSPITFERWTKHMVFPGNASEMILKNVHVEVLANSNRWWWIGITADKPELYQERDKTVTYRVPAWDTVRVEHEPEEAFGVQDVYTEKALYTMNINEIKIRATSVQVKVKCKTFRAQANLVSIGLEAQHKSYL